MGLWWEPNGAWISKENVLALAVVWLFVLFAIGSGIKNMVKVSWMKLS